MRDPFHALSYFYTEVLPTLRRKFVLITGSEYITLPRQADARWRGFDADERMIITSITMHPLLIRWYVENLDTSDEPKMSPLPLGFLDSRGVVRKLAVPRVPAFRDRPLRAFVAHRVRPGPQWETRRTVSALAAGPWRAFCTSQSDEIAEPEFIAQIRRHSFVLCAEGGGIDPSPKAWLSLLHGAVPIIRRHSLAPAYSHLPVAFVDEWIPEALTREKLEHWREALLVHFDDPHERSEVLHRLTLDYWWNMISAGATTEYTYDDI